MWSPWVACSSWLLISRRPRFACPLPRWCSSLTFPLVEAATGLHAKPPSRPRKNPLHHLSPPRRRSPPSHIRQNPHLRRQRKLHPRNPRTHRASRRWPCPRQSPRNRPRKSPQSGKRRSLSPHRERLPRNPRRRKKTYLFRLTHLQLRLHGEKRPPGLSLSERDQGVGGGLGQGLDRAAVWPWGVAVACCHLIRQTSPLATISGR